MHSGKKHPVTDLSALLKKLNEAGIEYVLVGGLAAVVQGAPITTFDIDIVPHRSDENIQRLYKLLKSVHAHQRRPDDKIIEPSALDLQGSGHFLFSTCFGPLDILATIEEGLGYHELLPSAVQIEFKGDKMYVLSLEKLINLKRSSTDPSEKYRLQVYRATLRLTRER